MKIISTQELQQLSFPDYSVLEMQVSTSENLLVIFVEAGWLSTPHGGEELKHGTLLFKNWETLQVKLYDHENYRWIEPTGPPVDTLTDLCEAEFSEHHVLLRGFGKHTGQWLEYKVVGHHLLIICYFLNLASRPTRLLAKEVEVNMV